MEQIGGTIAREVGAVLESMHSGNYSPVSLQDLKTAVGGLHYLFKGLRQHNSHDPLSLILYWVKEDLSKRVTLGHLIAEIINSKPSIIHTLPRCESA